MNYNIIGREKEIHELEYLIQSEKSDFLAVYGRRRVGKSYLIDEVYGANMVFRTVGIYIKNEDLSEESYRQVQLKHFYESLLDNGNGKESVPTTSLKSNSQRASSPLMLTTRLNF